MSCLPCLCLYVYSGVQHMSCCVFLRLVYSMLPVSLFFSSSCVPYVTSFSVFFTSCVPYVTSFSGLFFFVLCTLCCQFLWIVFLRLVYPMLPVSLDCFSSSCVPYVASFSGLFFFVWCTLCCQFLWIVFLRLVYSMLPVCLDCQFVIAPLVFSDVYL